MRRAYLKNLDKADILEKALNNQIRKGILVEGSRLLPEREISRKYKTSRGIVRKVLGKLVDKGILARRTKAGSILKALPPIMNCPPALKRVLCVFLPSGSGTELSNFPYMETIYQGVEKEALRFNCEVNILLGAMACKKISGLVKDKKPDSIDGVLVSGTGIEPLIDDLKKAKIPFVILNPGWKRKDLNCICPDNFQAGYLAAKHLLELGHRRTGFIYPVYEGEHFIQAGYSECLAGFQAVFREKGIIHDERLAMPLLVNENYDLNDEKYSDLERFLFAEQKITGVCLASDCLAAYVYKAAARHGKIIPDDLSVVCFGDTPICKLLIPAVTVVKADRFMMGQKAFFMLKSLAERKDQPTCHQVLAAELVRRGSTAPLKNITKE